MERCISLTTDFGDCGPYVGVMKAVILQHAPAARIHDFTHHIAPCQPAEAGFWIARSYRYLPAGSVHVVVVDPGVGTERALLACHHDGHYFLAPDNGILPMAFAGGVRFHALSKDWLARQQWPLAGSTFHGRDIFAPLAAAMLGRGVVPADIGPVCLAPVAAAVPVPKVEPGRITGRVVALDTWGNLITNIDQGLLAAIPEPRVHAGHRELPLTQTYGTAPPGALLALINSFGVVEIAWREGNAAQLLRLSHGATVVVTG